MRGRTPGAISPPPAVKSVSTPTVVTSTGAVGTLLSAVRDALVSYPVSVTTTATIAAASSGYVVLEIAPTNSATPGDWVEIGRAAFGQTISVAAALQSVLVQSATLCGVVPAGYYRKLRSVNVSGVPVYAATAGQEVLL